MESLIEVVLGLLNVDTTSRFVQDTMRQGPIDSVFYLIFFPTVFIILFIYIMSNWVLRKAGAGERGLRLLISVAIYAFIILQGWFTAVITLSYLWWFIIILLAGFWVFTHHFVGESGAGGGRGGTMPLIGGISSGTGRDIKDLAIRLLKGDIGDKLKELESRIKSAETMANKISTFKPGDEGLPKAEDEFRQRMNRVEDTIKEIEDKYKVSFPVLGRTNIGKYKTTKLWAKYNRLLLLEAREAV